MPDEPGDEDLERMNRLTRLVEEAAADTGVTLLDVDPAPGGYRYFLTAGAPTTVEDPEGRLLTAALRIVSSAQDYSLRAGVTSGRVFCGFVGAMFRQTYTVMGDPTNLAARLTSRAEPGTVLVDAHGRGAHRPSVRDRRRRHDHGQGQDAGDPRRRRHGARRRDPRSMRGRPRS